MLIKKSSQFPHPRDFRILFLMYCMFLLKQQGVKTCPGGFINNRVLRYTTPMQLQTQVCPHLSTDLQTA